MSKFPPDEQQQSFRSFSQAESHKALKKNATVYPLTLDVNRSSLDQSDRKSVVLKHIGSGFLNNIHCVFLRCCIFFLNDNTLRMTLKLQYFFLEQGLKSSNIKK